MTDFDEMPMDPELTDLLRAGAPDLDTTPGSPELFASIRAELGLGDGPGALPTPESGVTDLRVIDEPVIDDPVVDVGAEDEALAPVIDLSSRRRFGGPVAIGTLVAGLILLVAVPLGLALRGGDDPVELASARLDVLEAAPGTDATAVLLDDDGAVSIDIDTGLAADGDEFLELWLLDISDEGELLDLVSLGPVDASGRYEVPADVDLSRFDVVDISAEPDDGDPTHSGVSLVRGELA